MYQMKDEELVSKIREIADSLSAQAVTRDQACKALRDTLVESYQITQVQPVDYKDVENMGNIEAVKYIRSKMGLGLRESLDYFNRLVNRNLTNSLR